MLLRKFVNRPAAILSLAMFLLGPAHRAGGTLLPPGGTVVPANTTAPGVGAVLIFDSGVLDFSAPDSSFQGTIRSRLYTQDPWNPFGPFVYTYTYLVQNNGGGFPIGNLDCDHDRSKPLRVGRA